MQGQPAKVLGTADIKAALAATGRQRHPERNRAIILLSVRAGLRACEIAGLAWDMVVDARGDVGEVIELPAKVAKNGSGRRIPIHPELRRVLANLRALSSGRGTVIKSERGGPMTAKAVVNWFANLYGELGLEGCSSHSGRRTFVTTAGRLVHKAGGSLRDVQQLAGHRSIKTTQGYIEGDEEAQRRLVRLL
jgi:integrase/recombinase XerD